MTEQPPSQIGTVAQEAARLIEDMATMARASYSRGDDPRRYAGDPSQEPVWPDPPDEAAPKQDRRPQDREAQDRQQQGPAANGMPAEGTCSQCGADRGADPGDGPASNCTFCPLCRGIGLLRSVRPETVDLLADLAMSVAAGLREVALWSRTSDTTSPAASTPGRAADPDRAPVQDIPVDDESER